MSSHNNTMENSTLEIENMIPNAAIYIEDERDLMPGDTGVENVVLADIRDHIIPEVNQAKTNLLRLSCTITNAYRQIARLWNHKTDRQEEAGVFAAYARDVKKRDPSWGWGTPTGMAAAISKWNELYPNKKSMFLRVWLNDEIVKEALKKWHFVGFTYQWDAAYNADFSKDNVLDGTKFGKKYGHRTNIYWPIYEVDWLTYVNDSYAGNKWNQYLLKNGRAPLIKSGCFYSSCYIVIPQDNRDLEVIKEQKKDDNSLLQLAQDQKIRNTQRPNDRVIVEELNAMIKRRGGNIILGVQWSQKLTRIKCAQTISNAFNKPVDTLWNKKEPFIFATRKQAVLMVMRASVI